MKIKIKMKIKNVSHKYDINRTRRGHRHQYTHYNITCVGKFIFICNKPLFSKI